MEEVIKALAVLVCILLMLGTQVRKNEELERRYFTDREW